MRLATIAIAAALLVPSGTFVAAAAMPALAAPTEFSAAKKTAKQKATKKPAQEQFMRAAPSR